MLLLLVKMEKEDRPWTGADTGLHPGAAEKKDAASSAAPRDLSCATDVDQGLVVEECN